MDMMQLIESPSFWLDVLGVLLLVAFCSRYVRLGFLSAVVQICGTVLSLIGAHMFATAADSWVYETFFEQSLSNKVEDLVVEAGENGAQALSETVLHILPEGLQGLWQNSGIETSAMQASGNLNAMVDAMMESTVEPIVTQILFMVLFFAGFILCRILVSVLVNALRVANYIPVLGSVNRALGWLLGAAGGCLDLFLAFCVLWIFILLTDGTMPYINATALADSYLFGLFQMFNPFL